MNTPPPLPGKSADWWSRNWKWFVPLLFVAVVAVIGGFLFSIFSIMRSSDAYIEAVARAKAAPAVAQAIGTPITESWFLSGQIRVSGASGTADLAIPIEGSKGKATIYVTARKSAGTWSYSRLLVRPALGGPPIDLSDK